METERFKRWTKGNKVADELLKHGWILVPNANDGILGKGSFSKVYEVIRENDGLRAAAKVTRVKNEWDISRLQTSESIEKILQYAPDWIRKHFPIKADQFKISLDEGPAYNVSIYEILKPLTSNIRTLIWGSDALSGEDVDLDVASTDIVNRTAKMYLHNDNRRLATVNKLFDQFESKIDPQIVDNVRQAIQYVFEEICKIHTTSSHTYASAFSTIESDLMNAVNKIGMRKHIHIFLIRELAKLLSGKHAIESTSSYHADDYVKTTYVNEQHKDLMEALLYLRKNFNVKWGDMNSNNVMIRPSTNDYVVVDYDGFFV